VMLTCNVSGSTLTLGLCIAVFFRGSMLLT
jgi:hypothetical protein